MPNYCDFEMKIIGNEESRERFISYLNANYHYNIIDNDNYELDYCTADKHFFRVFEAEKIDEIFYNQIDPDFTIVSGNCAWSVITCMFNEPEGTYYGDWASHNFYNCDNFKGTHILEATKELNLMVEIFSMESGLDFMEHYVIDNGKLLVNDCQNYIEDYNEETEEAIITGGIDWEYTI